MCTLARLPVYLCTFAVPHMSMNSNNCVISYFFVKLLTAVEFVVCGVERPGADSSTLRHRSMLRHVITQTESLISSIVAIVD